MRPERRPKPVRPLDEQGLERLALHYAERFATTRAKLAAYLGRKVREKGWAGVGTPPVERLVERFAELGYVDDRAFAAARAASLTRRGYGVRRVDQALRAAGVAEADAADARAESEAAALSAAIRFAKRRRIGPYAVGESDRETRHKAAAAMLRAGHGLDVVRKILDASAADVPDLDLE